MTEDEFQRRTDEAIIVSRFYDYVERKRKAGSRIEVLEVPFLGAGTHPVAVVQIDKSKRRLFYAPSGRWKIRS